MNTITPDSAALQAMNLLKIAGEVFNLEAHSDVHFINPEIDRDTGRLHLMVVVTLLRGEAFDKLLFTHPHTMICGVYGYLREVKIQTYYGDIIIRYAARLHKDEEQLLKSLDIMKKSVSIQTSISCNI